MFTNYGFYYLSECIMLEHITCMGSGRFFLFIKKTFPVCEQLMAALRHVCGDPTSLQDCAMIDLFSEFFSLTVNYLQLF